MACCRLLALLTNYKRTTHEYQEISILTRKSVQGEIVFLLSQRETSRKGLKNHRKEKHRREELELEQ
jgi:hypothetical protein